MTEQFRLRYKQNYAEKIRAYSRPNQDGCWIWSKGIDKDGYGRSCYMGKALKAHRLSFLVFKGAFDSKLEICHTCDTPSCVNPEHLFVGTTLDNKRDSIAKGRLNPVAGELNNLSKLSEQEVKDIRKLRMSGCYMYEIAKLFNISTGNVHAIVHRRSWRHV